MGNEAVMPLQSKAGPLVVCFNTYVYREGLGIDQRAL